VDVHSSSTKIGAGPITNWRRWAWYWFALVGKVIGRVAGQDFYHVPLFSISVGLGALGANFLTKSRLCSVLGTFVFRRQWKAVTPAAYDWLHDADRIA
jgi:hypothetical protein